MTRFKFTPMTPWRSEPEIHWDWPYRSSDDEVAPQHAGWVEWHGGDCPLPTQTLVKVQYRGESREEAESRPPIRAGSLSSGVIDDWWKHQGPAHCNVVAYRVVEKARHG